MEKEIKDIKITCLNQTKIKNNSLFTQLLDLYKYIANKQTWANKILYREYKKEIKSCLTIADLHFYMQDLVKCTRLRKIDQDILMEDIQNKRNRILKNLKYID